MQMISHLSIFFLAALKYPRVERRPPIQEETPRFQGGKKELNWVRAIKSIKWIFMFLSAYSLVFSSIFFTALSFLGYGSVCVCVSVHA